MQGKRTSNQLAGSAAQHNFLNERIRVGLAIFGVAHTDPRGSCWGPAGTGRPVASRGVASAVVLVAA